MNVSLFERAEITIELYGAMLCLMSALFIIRSKMKKKSAKWLLVLLLTNTSTLLFEAWSYFLLGNTGKYYLMFSQIANFMMFVSYGLEIAWAVKFVIALNEENGAKISKVFMAIIWFFLGCCLFILIENFFTGFMYYFDEANVYHRNFLWYIYTGFLLVCSVDVFVLLVKYRKYISLSYFLALLSFLFIPVISILAQTVVYGIPILSMGIAISLVVVLLLYIIDWAKSESAFVELEKKKRAINISIFLIMIISIVISIFYSTSTICQVSYENSESNSVTISNMIYSEIENKILRPITVTETMAKDSNLIEYLQEESPTAIEQKMIEYLNGIQDGFGYSRVYCVNEKTKAYYSMDGICKYIDEEHDRNDSWYKEFIKSGKDYELNVDTDETNDWNLSVFVNRRVEDSNGRLLGVCGVGINMNEFKNMFRQIEQDYDVKISMVDKNGLIQIDAQSIFIQKDYLDNSYFDEVGGRDFYYERLDDTSRMTKYVKDMGWYLVIEDNNPSKVDVELIIVPSIIILLLGMLVLSISYWASNVRVEKMTKELMEKNIVTVTDILTRQGNRYAYTQECKRLEQLDSLNEYSIILMDINGLKTINDTVGHDAGDELIIGAAKCIENAFSKYGNVFRIGGDEFVVILKCEYEQLQEAIEYLDNEILEWKGEKVADLSISKGVVRACENKDLNLKQLIKLADKLMYKDKNEYYRRTGKDRRMSW